jgi:mannitol-1-phosphate/altronate dehydrogenase
MATAYPTSTIAVGGRVEPVVAGSRVSGDGSGERCGYDRRALVPAVVHLGLGAFHRSHQGVYFDELARVAGPRWGVVGASLRTSGVVEALKRRQGLYTVLERDGSGESARVVSSLVDCIFAPDSREMLVERLSDNRTQVVTLTITGDGYRVDRGSRPQPGRDGRPLWTAWDYLAEALERRRRHGIRPFTVLSCDNVPDNGTAARDALIVAARTRDEVLAKWIERNVAFPHSMVDRITPAAEAAQRDELVRRIGFDDGCSVVAESFSQWVIGDEFCGPRPPLELVGVEFVPDVTPYAVMKNRLLNGCHSALGYIGAMAGYDWSDEAMADELVRRYIAEMMEREIAPLLARPGSVDLGSYQRTLLRRFANPAIRDPLARLCRRGSTKMPSYLLPSLREASRRRRPRHLLTLAVAAWLCHLRGSDGHGRRWAVTDPRLDELQPLVLRGGCDPRPILGQRDLFGDLIEDEAFVAALERIMVALSRRPMHEILRSELAVEASAA